MNKLDLNQIKKSLIDISKYDVEFMDGNFSPSENLFKEAAKLLDEENGYLVFYGINKLVKKFQLNLKADLSKIYDFYETLFNKVMSHINMDSYTVIDRASRFAKMDVDGFNVNQNFSHDGKISGRAFITSKCIHFDTATPFIANIYGPNTNISDGYPIISDTKRYCADKNLDPRALVTNIPDNYNIVIKEKYYNELLRDYSFYLKINLDTDVVMIMLSNEVKYGVAHGATNPHKTIDTEPSLRPIRHFEYQYHKEEHYGEWLHYYGIPASEGRDYDGKINLSLDYYEKGIDFSANAIEVNN